MTNRDKKLLKVLRTFFMLLVGFWLLAVPWLVPDRDDSNWVQVLVPWSISLMILYVEGSLWYHRRSNRRRDEKSTSLSEST